jgi:lipopolysaccharide transport system permease protein
MNDKKIIHPGPDSFGSYINKVLSHRALIASFAKRDLKVKYAQTFLGVSWTLIQPAVFITVFSFFFGYILNWKTGDMPFPIYVCSGLLGWNLFSYIVFQGSSSVLESSQIIKKIYFPKLLLPLSKVLIGLVELGISSILLVGLMIFFGIVPSWRIIFLPVAIAFTVIAAFTVVVWAGAFSYKKRDLIHLIPFIIYFGIWVTPVFFTSEILPGSLGYIWKLNPMSGIIDMWRWCLLPGWKIHTEYFYSVLCLLPILFGGLLVYIKNEASFSDFS